MKVLNKEEISNVLGGRWITSESESITCIFTAAVKCDSEAVSK